MDANAKDTTSGLTDREAYRLICAQSAGRLMTTADQMGISHNLAYNVALGRSIYWAQYDRCISNPVACL